MAKAQPGTFNQLPRWKCNKEVWGDKIVEIRRDGRDTFWVLACGRTVYVRAAWAARGAPEVGDYYVLYDDGHNSWSPAKAFEDGYTRIV